MRDFSRGALLLPGILLLTGEARAETVHDAGLWTMVWAQGSFGNEDEKLHDLRWWFDGQLRFLDNTDGFSQALVRPGLGYAFTDEATAWLGYAWILTSPPVGSDFDEHRIWQQFMWSTKWESLGFSSRTRLEQRFVETGDDVGWRFRQFFKVSHPIAFDSRLSVRAYDEVFLNLNSTDWGAPSGFDQNRLWVGLGWTFNEHVTLEAGYLNQYIRRGGGAYTMNHIVAIHLLLSF
jgi:hypothetical protein